MACTVLYGSSQSCHQPFVMQRADSHNSPSSETPTPFHLISEDPADIAAMKKAEKNPQLVILSDWDHLTAAEYQKAQEDSRMNIM